MGNICRSPTAEGVMRKLAADAAVEVELDSAGTGDWHAGELPDPRACQAAARRGYELTHRARQFVTDDFTRFDLVLAMDRDNLARLQQQRQLCLARIARDRDGLDPVAKLCLLRSFESGTPPGAEVPDPYGGGGDDFERVLDICERACRGVLEHLRDPDAHRR